MVDILEQTLRRREQKNNASDMVMQEAIYISTRWTSVTERDFARTSCTDDPLDLTLDEPSEMNGSDGSMIDKLQPGRTAGRLETEQTSCAGTLPTAILAV